MSSRNRLVMDVARRFLANRQTESPAKVPAGLEFEASSAQAGGKPFGLHESRP